ncbi:MAG: hypothetical protein ACOCUT_01445 [bacterium]
MEALNHYVIVDTGVIGKTTDKKTLKNGSVIHLVSKTTDDVQMLKISGKVISAPKRLVRTRENKLKYKVEPRINDGDTVFFKPHAQSYCENKNLRIKDTVLAIPYHFMIAKIGSDNEIEMLNGRILVEEIPVEEETKSGLIIPEVARKREYNLVKVKKIGKEKFYGAYFVDGQLHEYGDDKIDVGDTLLVNKNSDFHVQGLVKDNEEIDYKYVERESIVAVIKDDGVRPYGMYAVAKPLRLEEKTKGGIIIPDNRKMRPVYAEIIAPGSGVRGVKRGDVIKFRDKKQPMYKAYIFVHNASMRVKMRNKEDFQKWEF